ncbi:MAG: dTDP-4-amino-4,6-dideoxygalactose transaminase [Oleiphilaceae bacterium]|jgi:dTDP-4-amino-4,6-dideoxygalactose transaminase
MNKIRLSKSSISDTEKSAVMKVLTNEFLGMGDVTQAFEKDIGDYLGIASEFVACVNTGTSALHIALSAIDIKVGDEVLVPSLTYVASFQAISALGAIPIPCEVSSDTLFIDTIDARSKITAKTKAIMPVHYGSSCKGIEDVYLLANEFSLRVIEDAAQAFGSMHNGKQVGSFGDIVCFSFDGIKNITCGEGGAVISKDKAVINKVKDGRLLGVIKDTDKRYSGQRSWDFDVNEQGFRYHLSNINAAIGRAQIVRIDDFKQKRRSIAMKYISSLSEVVEMLDFNFDEIMPHIFVIKAKRRNELRDFLLSKNIEVGIHYKPNHLLSKFKSNTRLPITESIYEQSLSLPCHYDLSLEEQDFIIQNICDFYEK